MIDMALIAVPLTARLSKLTRSFWLVARRGRTMVAESRTATVTSGADRLREVTMAGGYYRVIVPFDMPDTVKEVIDRCVVLMLVVDEIGQETLLFTAPLMDEGYFEECAVLLPEGTYSIYCFILDSRSPTIEGARLYGIGLPISGDDVEPANTDGVYALMMNAVFDHRHKVRDVNPLLVMDTAEYAGLPRTFGEYLAGVGGFLTGRWRVRGMLGGSDGVDTAVDLIQMGSELIGTATSVVASDEDEAVVQRLLSGVVDGAGRFELTSRHERVLKGRSKLLHQTDAWSGVIRDVDTLVGHGLDATGAAAEFVMTRHAD